MDLAIVQNEHRMSTDTYWLDWFTKQEKSESQVMMIHQMIQCTDQVLHMQPENSSMFKKNANIYL